MCTGVKRVCVSLFQKKVSLANIVQVYQVNKKKLVEKVFFRTPFAENDDKKKKKNSSQWISTPCLVLEAVS